MKKKVLVGMSGGVDSSVAAYLLKEQGYEVIGATMQIWQDDEEFIEREGGCCSLSAVADARRVANKIGIPFYVMNFKDAFKKNVIDYFVDEYMEGRTPNPCVACNKFIKFSSFLDKAMTLGIDYVATGHYAIIEKQNNRYIIRKSEDDKKDQTYALYNLTQFQLERTLMPCGQYKKSEIREIAKDIGLRVHNKKDSQEICFIPDNDHGKYIKNRFPSKVRQGNFVDKSGNILGTHKGIVYYIPFDNLKEPMEVEAKIRYSQIPSKAVITPMENSKVKVNFIEKQRAITKGQSVVFYKGDLLIGGGIIE